MAKKKPPTAPKRATKPTFDTSGVDGDSVASITRAFESAFAKWQNAVRRSKPRPSEREVDAFDRAASRLVSEVATAMASGRAENVLWLEKNLTKRKKRAWLQACTEFFGNTLFLPHMVHKLIEVDPAASALMPMGDAELNEDPARIRASTAIWDARRNPQITTLEGFAANLACACGALGYGPSEHSKAKKAFENLAKD